MTDDITDNLHDRPCFSRGLFYVVVIITKNKGDFLAIIANVGRIR